MDVYRSVGRSVGRSVSRPVGRSVGRSIGRSVGWSIGQSVSRSVGRSIGRSVSPGGASHRRRQIAPKHELHRVFWGQTACKKLGVSYISGSFTTNPYTKYMKYTHVPCRFSLDGRYLFHFLGLLLYKVAREWCIRGS